MANLSRVRFGFWYSATLDIWPIVDAVTAYCDRTGADFTETIDRVDSQISRFKWCSEVCFAHQAWVRMDFETGDSATAERRAIATQAKLARLAARYAKESSK